MNQKGFSWVLIIVLVAIGFGGYLIYQKGTKPVSISQPSPSISDKTPQPTQDEIPNWKTYTDKDVIENTGFYLKIPNGWIVKYRKEDRLSNDYKANFRINFDFSPPGWKIPSQSVNWMGWREMSVDVYGPKPDINNWITDYLPKYKDGLIVSETKTIGNKIAYLISASPNSLFFEGWRPRYVILGKDYSYELGFNTNGETNSSEIIEKDIYPGINFN